MTRVLVSTIFFFCLTGIAAACPNWQAQGMQSYYTTGQDLWSPNSYNVVAGGGQYLPNCGFSHTGYVISSPDFEFQLDGLESYGRLNIRVNSSCDTVLLVNDANANWYFNDDSDGLQPAIDLMNPRSGVYDIWVGTYGPDTCNATLTLETF